MEKEQWRPVAGFRGYEVSNFGRIRSYRRHRISELADNPRRILSSQNKSGYAVVCLMKEGKRHPLRVHKLVTCAFLGPIPEGLVVCHNDDDGHNNHLSNLRYDTQESNLRQVNSQIGKRLFNDKQVFEIRLRYSRGETSTILADEFGCSPGTIRGMCSSGHTYKNYDGPVSRCYKGATDETVREIRRLKWHDGITGREIAKRYGMSESNISLIINHKRRRTAGGLLAI